MKDEENFARPPCCFMSIKRSTLGFSMNYYCASFQDHILSGNSVAAILQAHVSLVLLLLNIGN
jgi:hypothetical protein